MQYKKIQIVKDLRCLWIPKFRGGIVGSVVAYMCSSFGFVFCWCPKNIFKIAFWNAQMWSQCCVWGSVMTYTFHNLNCEWVVLYFGKWMYLVQRILHLCVFCRCNREAEVGVYSESRCRSAADHFFPTWSPQKQYFGVSHCGCWCWVWKSNVCLFGNRLWGNIFNLKFKLLSILNTRFVI